MTTDDAGSTSPDDLPMAEGIKHVLEDARVLFEQHPELARSATVVRAELCDATLVTVQAGGYAFLADEPRAAGGGGVAPTPVQYALASLASGVAITYRYWSELVGIPIDLVKVEVRGEADLRGFLGLDPSVAPGLSAVQVRVIVHGAASDDEYRRLHDAVDSHCPVLALFSNVTTVTTTVASRTNPEPASRS